MSPLIGYLAAGLIGLSVAFVAVGLSRRESEGVASLARAGIVRGGTVGPGDRAAGQALLPRLLSVLTRRVAKRREMTAAEVDRVRARLDRAGLNLDAEALLALKVSGIGAGLVMGLVAVLFLGMNLPGALVAILGAGAVGYISPDLYVLQTAQRRQAQIAREIPETLDLLALTAQAGLGLEQGIAEVTSELPGPLGAEFDRFLKEQQLGVGRQQALHGLMQRNACADLTTFVQALLQADELGTPISKTLQVQAQEMRRRRRARARERAGKAPVKLLFPLIFGIFPALFVIIMGPGAIAIVEALGR